MYNNNYSNNGYGNNNMYSGSYGSNYDGGIAKPNSYGHNNNAYSSYGSGYGNNAVNRMNSSYSAGKSGYGMSNNGMMANQPMQSYSSNYSPANSSYLGNRSNSASSTKYMQNGYGNTGSGYGNTGSGYLNNDSEIHGRPVTRRGVEVKELRKKDSSGFLYTPKVSGSERVLRKSENPKNIESHDPSGAEKYSKALSIYPKERASGFFGKLSEIMEKDYLREEGKELLGFKKSNQKEDEEMEISYENVGKNLFSKYKDGSGNSERNSKLSSKSSNSVKKRGSLFGGGSSNNDDGGDDEEERQLAKKKKARNKLDYFDDDYDTSDIFDYDENFDNPQMYRDQVKKILEFFKKEGLKNKRVAKFQFFQFLKDVKNDIFDTKIKVFFAAFLSIFIILSVYGYIVSYINPSSLLESYYSNRVSIEVLDEKYKSLISTKDEESTFFLPDIEKTQLPLVIKSLHSMLENKNECKDIRILSAKTQCYYNLNNFVDRVAFKDKVESLNILQRWIASYWIISELSEDKILQFYLNFAYFGKDIIGFESAAKKIFKKTYKELNLKENIFLVSLIYKYNRSYYQNYNPEINQETLLNYMIDKNIIDQSQIANLDNTKFEEIPYNDNLYYMIYDDVMKKNVLNLKKYHNIRVTTTFNSDLSNILASLTKNVLLANDIPNASVVIVKKGQVKVSFTQAVSVMNEDVNKDLDKDLDKENKDNESSVKTIYFNKFPIFVANLAFKPFIYLIALDNNISVPNNFLTSTYETLFSDYYLYKEEKDEYYQQFVKNANILASIKKFSLLEKQLMGKIGEEKLTSFLKTFKLSIVKNPFNYKDVYHGDLIKSDLFNATSLFYTIGNAGTFGNYYYIKKINNFYSKKYKEEKLIDVANLKYVEESFQQKIYSSNRTEFYLTVDRNVAFAFNNEYVVAIWLGDMDKTALENFEKNHSIVLKKLIKQIVALIK